MANKKLSKNVILILSAALGGISGATVASYVKIYDSIFARYDRPEYALIPGLVCFDRLEKPLKRKDVSLISNDNLLKGYHYLSKKPKGLVVIAHGMHSGADDYLNIISYMVKSNFDVFAINYTGTFESEGDSTVGMCQSLVDIDNTIAYIQKDKQLSKLPLFLIGHSWGGYAVASVLSLKTNIKACACISSIKNGYSMPLEKAEQYVGKISSASKPFLNTYQTILFGSYTKCDAIKGINDSNIPILVAHGVDDKVVTFDGQSILSLKDQITNPNVIYYIGKGLQGDHVSILHSINAIAYQKNVASDLKLKKMQKKEELTNEEKAMIYSKVNHELYSQVNEELFEKIVEMFNSTL